MKKKILGIFVCMLLIVTAFPAVGTFVIDNLTIRETSDDYNNLIQQIFSSGCSLGDWTEQDKLTAADGATGDYFGLSVSIDGDYALVGAFGDDSSKGSAYVFKRSGITWTQEDKLTAADGTADDWFGRSVSIDGDYALVGTDGDDDNKGSAYVFKRSGITWTQEDKLTAADGATYDAFGESVSIDGDYALVGAGGDDSSKGSAYVFKRSGTTWTQEDKLTAADGTSDDYFGLSVSIDGDYALVGAVGDDTDKGSAYVFKRSGTTWTQEDKLTAADGATDDAFGLSVSIDGDYALVGAFGDDTYKGSAYVFKQDIPVGDVTAFIFGRLDNLTTAGEVITFEALNIRIITFFPFTFNHYTSGEHITILKKYIGFVGARFIFALCGLIYPSSTISMNIFDRDDSANKIIWMVGYVEGNPLRINDVETTLLNESGESQPDAEITFLDNNADGLITPGDIFTVVAPSDGYYVFMLTHKLSGAILYKSALTHY